MLTPKQSRFVEEYLVDLNGKQAAIRAGYSANTAEVQASRLLRIVKIQVALSAAMRARSRNTEVTPDRVLAELAKIGFANMRDYWPKEGETVDLHRLDQELTAARHCQLNLWRARKLPRPDARSLGRDRIPPLVCRLGSDKSEGR